MKKHKLRPVYDSRMHTDNNGNIWLSENKNQKIKAYVAGTARKIDINEESNVLLSKHIKILGSAQNAELICHLMDLKLSDQRFKAVISIGSPVVYSDTDTIEQVFTNMEAINRLPASCGGWHNSSKYDSAIYKLIMLMNKKPSSLNKELYSLLRKHPAWSAISFIPTINLLSTAKTFCHIIDPRWFVDPNNPDRTSRLRSYLGLRPDNVRRLNNGNQSPSITRLGDAIESWSSGKQIEPTDKTSSFLWRKLSEQGTLEKGSLSATIMFINFIRSVWLDTITPNVELFIPEYFFEKKKDAETFRWHITHLSSSGEAL